MAWLRNLNAMAIALFGTLAIAEPQNFTSQTALIDLSKSETATFSFSAHADGQAFLRIFGPDWREVANVEQENIHAGDQVRMNWDGLDREGNPVADESYFGLLEFADIQGNNTSIDGSLNGPLGSVLVLDVEHDVDANGVRFKLEIPARVTIYAVIDDGGPLMNTLLSAVPYPAGEHFLPWDGLDKSGLVEMATVENFRLFASARTMVHPSVIIRGSTQDPYPLYTRAIAETMQRKERPDISEFGGAPADLPKPEDISPEPAFDLNLAGDFERDSDGVPLVAGEVALSVSLDPNVRVPVLARRFEIVLFANYEFQTEVEEGRSPATVIWDATKLASGDYTLTVNVATLPGQLSAASMRVRLVQ